MLRLFVSKNSITPNDSISIKKNDDNVFSDFINEYIELLKKVEPAFYEYIMKRIWKLIFKSLFEA
jgi:hypothetical protein